jgi:hypothetical protein
MFNIFKKNKITEKDIDSLSDEIAYLKHEKEYFLMIDVDHSEKLNKEILEKENIFKKMIEDYQSEVN